jgi:AcrR family transcriptional regulator
MRKRAYRRLTSDDRRRQLLDRAVELFAEHGYDELSMAGIAKAAGISKPLLYHYFPGKRQLFEAALSQAAEQHLSRVAPEPGGELLGSLDVFLGWVDDNAQAYVKLMRSAGVPEVRDLIDRVREETAQRILAGLGDDRPPVRAAVRGWLWSMDGVLLDWVTERDLGRDEVRSLLLGMLSGSLAAAGVDVQQVLA